MGEMPFQQKSSGWFLRSKLEITPVFCNFYMDEQSKKLSKE